MTEKNSTFDIDFYKTNINFIICFGFIVRYLYKIFINNVIFFIKIQILLSFVKFGIYIIQKNKR